MEKNIDNVTDMNYDELGCQEVDDMKTREVLNAAFRSVGITQAQAAKAIGWSPQQLGQKLLRKSLRSDEFMNLMDAIGVEVTFTVRESGEILKAHVKGHGRRVKGMSDGVQYDTAYSEAISNNFYENGEHEYGEDGTALELYTDPEGRYFMAEYTADEPGKDRVRSVPGGVAKAFIEKYGTEIEKKSE